MSCHKNPSPCCKENQKEGFLWQKEFSFPLLSIILLKPNFVKSIKKLIPVAARRFMSRGFPLVAKNQFFQCPQLESAFELKLSKGPSSGV